MKRTTLLTLAVVAGWAGAAAAQTPVPADQAKTALQNNQVQTRNEAQARQQVESRNAKGTGQRFVDADGDGTCDNCQRSGQGRSAARGRQGRGPGDGTGNQGVGPRDGSGRGAGAGNCTGSGSRRGGNRGGRR